MSTTHLFCQRANFIAPVAVGLALGVVACGQTRAQGVLQFENMSGTTHRAQIYGVDNCSCAKTGNSASGIPAGAQTYSGTPLSGTGFTIELWAAPSDAPDSSLAPVARTTFRTGAMAGFFFPVNAAVPAATPGATLKCQARAWNNASGTVTSWNQAQCAGAQAGSSTIFTAGPIPVSGSVMTTDLRSFCLVQLETPVQGLFLNITRNGNTTVLNSFDVNHLVSGDDVQIAATGPALQSPTLQLQWRQNGLDLLGATNVLLDLAFVDVSQTGHYSLLAEDHGCSRELPFDLQVHPPPSLSQPRVDGQGKFYATVITAPFRAVIVETSTHLSGWTQASTGTADATGAFQFSQAFPPSSTGRFIRARVGP